RPPCRDPSGGACSCSCPAVWPASARSPTSTMPRTKSAACCPRETDGVFLLQDLPEDEAARVLDECRARRYRRREALFHEGDAADCVHFVVSGTVAVRVTTAAGDQATLDLVGQGDCVGELALLPP